MSLIIAISDGFSFCVAADTRSVSTLHGPNPDPAEKLRIVEHNGERFVVAVAGEAEIGGEKVLDLVSKHPSLLGGEDGLRRLTESVAADWERDVLEYEWEDEEEKAEYVTSATISIIIVRSPTKLHLIEGTSLDLGLFEIDFSNDLFARGTTSNIHDVLRNPRTERSEWHSFLYNVFRSAQERSRYVAEPIDYIEWYGEADLSMIHRVSLEELEKNKNIDFGGNSNRVARCEIKPPEFTSNDDFDEKCLKMARAIQPFVSPLLLLPRREATPSEMINCGSAGLIDTGTVKLLVTCHHVWDQFTRFRRDNPKSIVVLGLGGESGMLVVNDFKLLDSSRDLDIAVIMFDIPDALDGTSKRFARAATWPPQRPEVGELIASLGWPEKGRSETANPGDNVFRGIFVADLVASVSERHSVLADSPDRRVVRHEDAIEVGGSHGGMSGCPAFAFRDGEIQFVGILYESSDGAEANFFISHGSYITANGHIDRGLAPPSFL